VIVVGLSVTVMVSWTLKAEPSMQEALVIGMVLLLP